MPTRTVIAALVSLLAFGCGPSATPAHDESSDGTNSSTGPSTTGDTDSASGSTAGSTSGCDLPDCAPQCTSNMDCNESPCHGGRCEVYPCRIDAECGDDEWCLDGMCAMLDVVEPCADPLGLAEIDLDLGEDALALDENPMLAQCDAEMLAASLQPPGFSGTLDVRDNLGTCP